MMRISLIVVALVALVGQELALAKSSHLIDQETTDDVETIAQIVCEVKRGTSKLIGHSSTISKLASFFGQLPSAHKLAGCKNKYAQSIERLAEVLTTNNDDVCSEGKLSSIEQYHHDYVSKLPKHLENRKSRSLNIPKLVKLFFMSYAAEVSSICARDSLKQMETLEFYAGDKHEELTKADALLARFTDLLGINKLEAPGYSELFLLWQLIDGLPLEKYTKVARYVAQEGDTKLFIKVKEANKVSNIQAMCYNLMKPIYGRVLMPVIRLIGLGYYPDSPAMAQQLAQESNLRRLYVAAQLCETLLPIHLTSDPSLADDQILLVRPGDINLSPEAMPAPSVDETKLGFTPAQNSLHSFEINLSEGTRTISDIKADVLARSKGLAKIFKLLMKTAMVYTKSTLKRIFVRRSDGRAELVEPTVEDEAKVEEAASKLAIEYESDEAEEDEEHGVARRKRSNPWPVWKLIKNVFMICVGFLVFLLMVVGCLFQLFVMLPIWGLYELFRHITGLAFGPLESAIEFGVNNMGPIEFDADLTWRSYEGGRVKYIGPGKRRAY